MNVFCTIKEVPIMKKLLALVLCAAMVLSLVCVAGAVTFSDAGQIRMTNTEAVEVLSGLKIIGGMGNGKFAPNDTLTRAQAAKIITYMLLGETAAEALPAASASFSDVPTSHWSCKYVNYCAQQGIVSGVGNGKFNPNGKLTGYAFGKMLLVSGANFNADEEGLVGASWEANVNKLLKSERISMGVTVSANDLARQDACHLALNTLFYGEENDPYSTLAYKTFKLIRDHMKGPKTQYYRPQVIYSTENDGAYWEGTDMTVTASPFFYSANGSVSGGKLFTACCEREVANEQITLYRNGAQAITIPNTIAKGSSDPFDQDNLQNGTSLEVYYDAINDAYTFIVLGFRSAIITAVTPAVKDSSGNVIEPGEVSLSNGCVCQSSDFSEADVGQRVLTKGVSTTIREDFKTVNEIARGTVVKGKLTAAEAKSVTVGGKYYGILPKLATTTGETYLANGGQIGDEVSILVDSHNIVYDIWH